MNDAHDRVQADRAMILFGTAQAPPERIALEAGPLTMTLENGALRWIRLGAVRSVRMS